MNCTNNTHTLAKNPCAVCQHKTDNCEACKNMRAKMLKEDKRINNQTFRKIFSSEKAKIMFDDFVQTGHFTPYDDYYDPQGIDAFNHQGINKATGTEYTRIGVKKTETWHLPWNKIIIDTNLLDENGLYLGHIDSEGYDRKGFHVESYKDSHLYYCVIRYPEFKTTDLYKQGFTRNNVGPHGEDRRGFLKNGTNYYTGTNLDRDGFYKSGLNPDGYDREGNMPDYIALALDFLNSDSLSIKSYSHERGIHFRQSIDKLKKARQNCPALAPQLEGTTDIYNQKVLANLHDKLVDMVDEKISVEEGMRGINLHDAYIKYPDIGARIVQANITYMRKMLEVDYKKVIEILAGTPRDITTAIHVLTSTIFNIKMFENSFFARRRIMALREIVAGLRKYQGNPTSLYDTTVIKNDKRFHFTPENVTEISDTLEKLGEIVCVKTIEDYAFSTI